ncbi:MAG: hypothetical protein HY762_07965 [Planctomycetes bacterium]|nr:hypothetical protein [Planctomycetota bacterium]
MPAALTWSISGVDTTLYSAEITADKKLKITPVSNKNGSDVATLTLRDSAGLTASQNITIYITAVNDKPTITLTQPGMASGEIKTGNVPITWNTVDVDGDALAINIYYNLADGTWLTIATNQPNTGSYSWNTLTVRDDYRYKIRVECLETGTAEKYSDAKFSANYFTIDNGVLIITPLDATPPHLNPDTSEKNLLPFELSEPAFDVYVTVVEVMIGQVKLIGPLALDAGIHSVEWNGRNNAGSILPPDDFIFRVSGKERDLLQTSVTSPASSTFSIVSGTPRFVILGDSPDPFNPFIGEKNTIQYIIYSGGFQVYTTLKIMDEGGNIKATLLNNVLQNDMTNYPVEWDGADITENGIFSYVLSGTKAPSGELANPVTGVITVIGADKKVVQSGDVTVYARPGTADVTITTPVSIASDVTYALGSLNIAPPYTYPVSPFYEIVATTPPVLIPPIIIAISYPSYLAPDYLKLFKYNTATPGFIAVGRSIVDPLNHILYAEVDSLSLFVLMASSDITKPQVQNIVLTPQILNFTLTDESSGINVPSIRVIMDGAEITDRLTFSGATGDLTITVSGTYTFLPYPDTHTMTIIAQDRGGNETTKTVSFGSGYADAKVALKPESLNINPGVLTAYLKLPQPFGIPTTVEATLDGGALERWMIDEAGLPEEGLFGPVVVLKFRRQAIADALAQQGEVLDTEFILKGKFDDGTAPYGQPYDFEGKDSITKIVSEPAVSESAPVVTEPPPSDSGNNGNNKGGKKK